MTDLAIYPGTFDPITKGHFNVITRAAQIFPQLTVAVLNNPQKKSLLSLAQRLELTKSELSHLDNVMVESFEGLLVDYAAAQKADVIVRSFRNGADIEYELPQAMMNRRMKNIETVFLPPSPEFAFISSSLVREIAGLGGDVSAFVSAEVCKVLQQVCGG